MSRNNFLKNPGEKEIEQAVKTLNSGGVIGFPTETYYGLGVDPYNEKALKKLFHLKGREKNKPIILLVNELTQLLQFAEKIPDIYKPLIDNFWPGPLTLVFKAKRTVSTLLTGGTGTIGMRISPNVVAQTLITQLKKPLTATSANISGKDPAKTEEQIIEYFGKSVDFVLSGGETKAGLCSTVVGLKEGKIKIIREGAIPLNEIQKIIKK